MGFVEKCRVLHRVMGCAEIKPWLKYERAEILELWRVDWTLGVVR